MSSHEKVVFDGLFKKIDYLNAMLMEKMQVERDVYMQLKESLKRAKITN